jgi:DNA-binding response OmpR family regulator
VPNLLLATDADYIYDEVDAALGGPYTVHRVHAGADVLPAVRQVDPVVVVLDLQIGNMGGMAACLNLRLEERAGRIEARRVLMLLDREADVFLAQRAESDGWLIKPLDAFRLRRAVQTVLDSGTYVEGLPATTPAS